MADRRKPEKKRLSSNKQRTPKLKKVANPKSPASPKPRNPKTPQPQIFSLVSIKKSGTEHEKEQTPRNPRTVQGRFSHRGHRGVRRRPEAFEEFFTQMPPDSGMAFIVVLHQHPGHESLLPSLLQKCTPMRVLEVKDGMIVKPNTVYLSLAGKNLAILNGALHLMDVDVQERLPLAIDNFFRSLAEDQKHQAIGIVRSGTGSDGTLGLKAIKGESGMTMAQEPKSAKYGSMPQSAISTGVVDYVCSAEEMPHQLLAFSKGPYLAPVEVPQGRETEIGQMLQKIFVLLRERTGNDFSLYKTNTIRRRIERRMNVHQIDSPTHYLRYVMANAPELDALFQEILIGVTSFFRDPLAFEVLAQEGIPGLLDSKRDGDPVRVWVPGCGSGEEAFSLAIVIREYMAKRRSRFHVKIFGTDLDEQAIDSARRGLYPVGIANDVTPERLQRFFANEDHSFRVKKEIRDVVIFAPHNVLADPPFTKLDLLSCRNLLIYLEARTQRRLFPLFHYALNPDGLLFLGSSETVGECEETLFETLDRKWKLFTRKAGETDRTTLQGFPVRYTKPVGDLLPEFEQPLETPGPSMANGIETMLLEEYAPASVIVNERGEIVYIHGRTGAYLEPAPGQAAMILINMAREGLRYDLSAALHQANQRDESVVKHAVGVKTNGGYQLVDLTVKRIADPEALRGLFLVTFQPQPNDASVSGKGKTPRKPKPDETSDASVVQELHYTKQRLQHTNEELQTANEELKSTNEELQSTNEKLETSKEELQSLNEELVTVNAELQGKINELSDANDDLSNLLNSTEVATIFLDTHLNIKRFTPAAKRVVNLIATDVGRPLADIASTLIDARLMEEAKEVLETLVYREHEVQTTDGYWVFLRILPYRTAKNTIDGLVLTFADITKVKDNELLAQEAKALAENVMQTVREPLLVLDAGLRVVSANQAFIRTFALSSDDVISHPLTTLDHGEWDIPALTDLLENVLPKHTMFQDFPVEHTFRRIGRRKLVLNARRLIQAPEKSPLILLAMEDITAREERERREETSG